MSNTFPIRAFSVFNLFNLAGETKLSPSEMADVFAYMNDYKALGHNAISLGWGVPIDPTTGARAASFSINTVHEASFDEIRQIANYAKSIGLQIILKPHSQTIIATGTNGALPDNVNSGSMQNFPSFSVTTFLRDWAAYMAKVSSLAQELGAIEIVIGTENHGLDTLEYRSLWQEVITAARSKFTGALSYDALFPLERNIGVDKVGFWDLLDIIGVSAYYPLTNKENPTYADVLAGWYNNYIFPDYKGTPVNVIDTLHAMSVQYGKPVQFEEFGAQSFHGVVKDPSGLTINGRVADWQQQAWVYQSALEAFAANNDSNWFRGVSAWGQALVPGQDDPRFAHYIADFGAVNFDVRGKDAAKVLSAWYGATNYLAYGDTSFTGSALGDRIAMYGKLPGASEKPHQVNTFPMTITFALSGTLLNGETPTVHFYANGTDYGTQKLAKVASGYVDSSGPWTTQQQFKISLPSTTTLSDLKVVQEASTAAGQEKAHIYLDSVSVNGVSLTQIDQSTKTIAIDSSAWNKQIVSRTTGTASQPIRIDAGEGTDTVYVLGKASQYTISYQGSTTVTLSEASGLGQNAVLQNTETIGFADGSLLSVASRTFSSLSVEGARAASHVTRNADGSITLANGSTSKVTNADKLAFADMTVDLTMPVKAAGINSADLNSLIELYIAYFNRVPDAEGLGYWIGELKGGKSLEQIGQSFYDAALQFSSLTGYSANMTNADFVKLVYANVLGRGGNSAPPQADIDFWAGNLASGTDTRGSLIKTMLGAAHSFKGDAQWGWVADLLDNKLQVGATFAVGYGLTYLNSVDSITQGMAIAAAVKSSDISAAISLIGISDTPMAM